MPHREIKGVRISPQPENCGLSEVPVISAALHVNKLMPYGSIKVE